MSRSITATLIPGDGIGPSITDAAVRLLAAAGAGISWDRQLAGMAAVKDLGDPLPDATLESIKRTRLALKGPLETPVGKGFRSINVALRKEFDLYANLRPAKSVLPGLRFDGVDIVLVRENTEGLYVGIENYVKVGDDPHAVAQSSRSRSSRVTAPNGSCAMRSSTPWRMDAGRSRSSTRPTSSSTPRDCSSTSGARSPRSMRGGPARWSS
jgi:isocitrate/isopropylmalate dehydrogenase